MLTSARRCVLIVDIMESVRLIEADQMGVISRWLKLVDHVEEVILPEKGGRLVKSLGDGMLLEFASVREALGVAFAILGFNAAGNEGHAEDDHIQLRLGMEVGDIVIDKRDVYGHGVNMAARLASLGGPGEIIVSAAVRDQLTPDLDADIEDMGDRFVKHVAQPVRCYRLAPPGQGRSLRPVARLQDLLPTLAVIPPQVFGGEEHGPLGQILTEELISALSLSPRLSVISRLSTMPFANGQFPPEHIAEMLKANHLLTGTLRVSGQQLTVTLELSETRNHQVIWSQRFVQSLGELLQPEGDMIGPIAEDIVRAIVNRELTRARSLPIDTLESYTLMLGAISGMYRLSRREFDQSRDMLNAVAERNPRQSLPLAWIGNWHVLRAQQGWTSDAAREQQLARDCTARALDLNPDCTQSLTIDGFIHSNLAKRYDIAEQRYAAAIERNASHPLAWLLSGALKAFEGDGKAAIAAAVRGQALSPFDPNRYFYDCLIGGCYAVAAEYDTALAYLQSSYRLNQTHTSTLRALIVAQWETGDHAGARETVNKVLVLQPGLTVASWLSSYTGKRSDFVLRAAEIYKQAGMPAA